MSGQPTVREFLANFENWCIDLTGAPPADNGYYSGAIYESFLSARATLVQAEQIKDLSSLNKFVVQNVGCIKLQEVRVEECPCAPPSGCTWFRTEIPIPLPIGDLHSVTSIGGNLEELQHFTYRPWHTIKFSLNARNPAERTRGYYTVKNNYLYVVSSQIKAVSLSGVFFDPVETQRHPQCEPFSDCLPFLDFPIYIDPAHLQTIVISTFQLISGMRANAPLDTRNNFQPAAGIEPVKE